MSILFLIAFVILASAAVAMVLRNLIHSALCLAVTWSGLAAFYLWADAEFIAFAQVLVYVGAISMVVLFAVLLTRRSSDTSLGVASAASLSRAAAALFAGAAVAVVLGGAVLATPFKTPRTPAPALTVRQLGGQLMGPHAAALLVAGLLLTVALLGAVVIAAAEPAARKEDAP